MVQDKKGEPLPFVNVYLKDIFDGTSTDEQGQFAFSTEAKGSLMLVASSLGYETYEQALEVGDSNEILLIILKPGGSELSEVVVSAGAFEASDEKKGTVLKPLDIVTNPAASGDLYGALQTLPGVGLANDETGLFVRGGEASETKTIMDGSLVAQPFFGDVPDIPARGRFNPFLFKGTLFSTGGYSAQYGQALSSVLILNTQDLPSQDQYSLSLSMAGIGGGYTKVWKDRTSLLGSINYSNLSVLYGLVPQNRDWEEPPNGIGGAVAFRHLTQKGDMVKSYLQYQSGSIALNFNQNGNPADQSGFRNKNQNLFWNNSYKGTLGKDWGLFMAASLSYDNDADQLNTDKFGSKEWLGQGRMTLSKEWGKVFTRLGTEVQFTQGDYYFNEFGTSLNNQFIAWYAESDVRFGKRLAARIGMRSEYAGILNNMNWMPRLSLTYKPGGHSLISLAYGQFYQTPGSEVLRLTSSLDFERSTHYILNYQWQTEQQIFRIEAYYKDYKNLVRFSEENFWNNNGFGFSKGIDVFWRDQKTIPNLTYWLSYSLIDAQRLYRDFPQQASPDFVSTHTLSVVANYRITPRWRLGSAYSFASGRPYFNPNNPDFLADRTINYHNLSLSGSYLTSLFGNFTVIYASLRNPLQFRQVFGYRYSADGLSRQAIIPATNWSFFAGVSVSIRK